MSLALPLLLVTHLILLLPAAAPVRQPTQSLRAVQVRQLIQLLQVVQGLLIKVYPVLPAVE